MNTWERLREVIDQREEWLRAGMPSDRAAAVVALVRARDRLPTSFRNEPAPDLISGYRLADLGGNKALQFCLEATGNDVGGEPEAAGDGLDGWGEGVLWECGRLAEAELVLGHCETGFMRLVENGAGTFSAWIATKRVPASWRERADVDWWAAWLGRRYEPELSALRTAGADAAGGDLNDDAAYLRLADVHVKTMAYQLGYPPDATIGGCTIQNYLNVLERLIAWAVEARDRGEATVPRSERSIVTALASALAADPGAVGRALSTFTLGREGAAYHAAVPGVAAAPLVRVGSDRLVWSVRGLTTEPLLFLTRELRRRAAQEYHNAAHLREGVFRRDLYALFADKRFVTSSTRVELRREAGDVRTDVDAVVFDRKSGTLGLFELKTQDPFARSTAELARQRDNVLYANRQISGALAWLQRHGGDALLDRVDHRTAKTFRVQKVFPFVLGRYLAHFTDGPEPDRRAAWGTWPQVLRLLDGQPFRTGEANPIAALFARLTKDEPLIRPPADGPRREIPLGEARLVVYPSFAAFQAGAIDRE
jgi:hypothetical protein